MWRAARDGLAGVLLVTTVLACRPAPPPAPEGAGPPALTLGVAAGEVTATSAVLWGRCSGPATLLAEIDGVADTVAAPATAATDFTAKIALASLRPATRYPYRLRCGEDGAAVAATFRTAPDPADPRPVRVVWSGDLGGQNVCRDAHLGYPIFATIAGHAPDLFIGLGDMIYADDRCAATGRFGNRQIPGPPAAVDLAGFRAHWRYNWADPGFQHLRATTPYLGVWDDHEIQNDSGPHDDATRFSAAPVRLLPAALRAFLEYQPLLPPADDPTRLHRAFRWGRHLALFVFDTRQYRDPLAADDRADAPKTLLGARQRAWLAAELARSNATWNVIVSSVPLAIPTGSIWPDGFADAGSGRGYEREAAEIFALLRQHSRRPPVWITTDVHFATGFRHRPLADDPTWTVYEFTAGPLNAGLFPTSALDPTFRPERLFFYGPPDGVTSFDEALTWFNFGQLDVAEDGTLTVSIVTARGETVSRVVLAPDPAPPPD